MGMKKKQVNAQLVRIDEIAELCRRLSREIGLEPDDPLYTRLCQPIRYDLQYLFCRYAALSSKLKQVTELVEGKLLDEAASAQVSQLLKDGFQEILGLIDQLINKVNPERADSINLEAKDQEQLRQLCEQSKVIYLTDVLKLVEFSGDQASLSSSSSSALQAMIGSANTARFNKVFFKGEHEQRYGVSLSVITEESKELGRKIQEQPETVSKAWGAIPKENKDFTGREALLRTLVRNFATTDGVDRTNMPIMTLCQPEHGLNGLGKTALAARYVHFCLSQQQAIKKRSSMNVFARLFKDIPEEQIPKLLPYHMILWLDATNEDSLLRSFQSCAGECGLAFEQGRWMNIAKVRKDLYAHLARLRVLLIFDNVSDQPSIEAHLPRRYSYHCLLTSRSPVWTPAYQPLEVRAFSPEESLAYLRLVLKAPNLSASEDDLTALAAALNHLPGTLAKEVGYMNTHRLAISVYLEKHHSYRMSSSYSRCG